MTGGKGKNILIELSDDDDEEFSDDRILLTSSSSEDCCELIDDDDDDFRSSEEDEEKDDDDDDDDDDDESDDRCEDDEHALYNQVLKFLQGKRDLQELSLKTCRSYLRKHGLRVSGNKDVCVQRVMEHWRIKDGKAEILYPRSSFNINCKGQVMFVEEILSTSHKRSMEVTRNGKLLGKRTVAGRVVKESYGAAKQQHTFTVEVLWSKGVKKLPPLFPLLVKGRNLYRLNTYRQPWKNEGERRNILAEKHRRGTAARLKRDKRKKGWSSGKGLKSQKGGHGSRSSKMNGSRGGNVFGREHGVSTLKHPTTNNYSQHNTMKQTIVRHAGKTKSPKFFEKQQATTLETYHAAARKNPNSQDKFHHGGMSFESGIADIPHFLPYGPLSRPAAQYIGSRHAPHYVHPAHIPQENYLQYFPSREATVQQQYGLLRCSNLGCIDPGSYGCVIGACWRCCRREGMRCNVHR